MTSLRVWGFTHEPYSGDSLDTVTKSCTPDESSPGTAATKPLDVDGVTAVASGIVVWALALAVLLIFFRNTLNERGDTWWIWVCVAGIGLGFIALPYVLRRRAVYRRARPEALEG